MAVDRPFEHRRGSFFIVLDQVSVLPFLGLFVFVILPLWRGTFDVGYLIAFVAFCLGMIVRAYQCLTTFFTVRDEYLLVESGLLQKKRLELAYHTITAIDLSQNPILRLVGAAVVKVDNAGTIGGSTVRLALRLKEAEALREMLKLRKVQAAAASDSVSPTVGSTKREQSQTIVTLRPDQLILYGVLCSKVVYYFTVLPALWVVWRFVAGFFFAGNENLIYQYFTAPPGLWFYPLLVCAAYILVLAFSIFKSVVTFYGFTLSRDGENFYIHYGLLAKKHYTIPMGKISGLRLDQSLFMRLARLYTAKIFVIGFGGADGNDTDFSAVLLPVADTAIVGTVLGQVVPNFSLHEHYKPVPAGALRYFFLRPLLLLLLLSQIVAVAVGFWPYLIANAVLLLLVAINCYLRYLHTGFHLGGEDIVLYGGGFVRTIVSVRWEKIENITLQGSRWKRRRGYVTVIIGFLAQKGLDHARAYHLPLADSQAMVESLRY